MSPIPLSIQRKELNAAKAVYHEIRRCLEKNHPRLLELSCEVVEEKKITLVTEEILAIQMYEKTSATVGSKRPGFSFES